MLLSLLLGFAEVRPTLPLDHPFGKALLELCQLLLNFLHLVVGEFGLVEVERNAFVDSYDFEGSLASLSDLAVLGHAGVVAVQLGLQLLLRHVHGNALDGH